MKDIMISFLLVSKIVIAQKPALDLESSKNWITVEPALISNDGNYVAYFLNNEPVGTRKLIIQSTTSNWNREFTNVRNPFFTDSGFLFQRGKDSTFICGYSKDDIRCVTVQEKQNSIDVEQTNMDSVKAILARKGCLDSFSISGQLQPLGNLKSFLIKLVPVKETKQNQRGVQLDVWSYMDAQLQSQQSEELKRGEQYSYTFAVDINSKAVFRLEYEDESIVGISKSFILVRKELGLWRGRYEAYWNKKSLLSFYLISLKDGSRKLLKENISNPYESLQLSPTGKWIVYFDFKTKNYYAYEMGTGITRNISNTRYTFWTDQLNDNPDWQLPGKPIKWLRNDDGLIISDGFDLWLADPSGRKKILNITNYYGKKHHIRFEVLDDDSFMKNKSYYSTLVLKAINTNNEDCGFYKITLAGVKDPELLIMGPYIYGVWGGHGTLNYPPLKAKNADVWLVEISSSTEAPNCFLTKDFKNFTKLTNVQPQKKYNWYTSELHQWKSLDGTRLQGILYKPENFDSLKKYPLIFEYYEKRSDELNLFIYPNASDGEINIPLFVSNGYLVFVPDIKYKIGYAGRSAYSCVVSAANYLSRFKWVDIKRMGLQGHSWGGFETNYIITHTNLFAAACSASGISDEMSKYGSALRGGFAMYLSEKSQGRIGGTLWEHPEYYINNSPIYFADKVSTPLLMMANRNDGAVPFSQGVELFTALRRLGKRVWMLQYDNGKHSVGEQDAEDYHTRMKQFFDHYLKDSACPKWMLFGIPAKDKGSDDGLQLVYEKDKNGKWFTPKESGLLTDEEKKKVETLKKRKSIIVTIE